ncbi:MAG: DUF4163 domain-containing protein [Spirochaetaceae bacterium]|nr:DUF4163 domain-containing protein [Spirochaetaceae bacterium]
MMWNHWCIPLKSREAQGAVAATAFIAAAFAATALASCATLPVTDALELRALRSAESGPGYTYVVEYPAFPAHPDATRVAESFARETIAAFIDEGRANRAAWEATASPEELARGRPPFELILDWRAERLGPEGISVLLEAYAYTGGAHGSLNFKSLNYDPRSRKLLTLAEVLGGQGDLEAAAAEARAELKERLNRRADPDMDKWIDEGTAPVPENFDVFVRRAGIVTVIFPPYQVAPWSEGMQRVELPLATR